MEKASPSESHRIRNWKWMSLSISNYWNSHFTCVCIGCIIYACEKRWTSELNLQFHFSATTVQSGLNKFITAIFESRCRLFFLFSRVSIKYHQCQDKHKIPLRKFGMRLASENDRSEFHLFIWWTVQNVLKREPFHAVVLISFLIILPTEFGTAS